jgi:hypothetical protein
MRRFQTVLAALTGSAIVAAGCGLVGGSPDAGLDADDSVSPPLLVHVSGRAAIHPAAEAWMTDAGMPLPPLEGLRLRLQEPFRLALQDRLGVLGETTLPANGEFSIGDVNTALVTRGIAASVDDPTDGGSSPLVPAATVVFDVKLNESLPQADITSARAWAIPFAYQERLTTSVGPARIRTLTHGNEAGSLIEAGFMLGRIVDVQGNPVIGAQIETDPPAWADRIFYPSDDLREVTQGGTSANGLFIFVHTGGIVDPFTFRVKDRAEYGWRNGGVGRGNALVFTVHPGIAPPP